MARSTAQLAAGTTPLSRDAGAPVSLPSIKELLTGLNREQRRAVTHREGPQLVIAGPGTGKTEVVARRIAWLIETKRARPREILALTFTDAAAEEMQARVDELVPYGQADAAIHTFHALGDRLLREHAFELGLPGDVRLVTRSEAVVLLREHLFDLGLQRYLPLGDPTRFLSALVDLFQRAKDEGITPEAYIAHARDLAERARGVGAEDSAALLDLAQARTEVAGAYAAYQRLLAGRGLIDHGDQVWLALRLLQDRPLIQRAVRDRYRYLLVDEFQDTNPVQLEMVFALTNRTSNVTVVGDPDQAIYTFRGAAVSNIRRFVAAHPDVRCVVLRRNYRSRPPIIETGRRLIEHNGHGALPLFLTANGGPVAHRRSSAAPPVRQLTYATPEHEADGIAEAIAKRIAAGHAPRDFAVLVRTNADAESFLRSLRMHGVPSKGSAPGRLVEQPTVRALLAYLRVVANPDDDPELYLLAAAQPYGMGQADLALMLQHARRRQSSLWRALSDDRAPNARLSATGRVAVRRLLADVGRGLEQAARRTSGEILYDHLRRTGMLKKLAGTEPDSAESFDLRCVVRFFQLVRGRASLLAEDRVALLVPHLGALDDVPVGGDDQGPLDDDRVSVLTVHRAKGLEFRCVYVCALVDGRFPAHGRPPVLTLPAELLALRDSVDEEDPLAEERRLAYVAMTRARDELWLSTHSSGPGGRGRRRPSPFLAEAVDAPVAAAQSGQLTLRPDPPVEPAATGSTAPRGIEEPLTLSFSQLDDYLSCPERYRLRYVIGVPTPTHHALTYGSAMHQAVAAFHLRRAAGVAMSEEELVGAFRTAWSPEGYLSAEHEQARYRAGCEALIRFRTEQLASEPRTVAIERPFAFPVGRDVVRGRMDRVDASAQGAVIVDYKSSSVTDPAKANARARDSLQLQIYALAHEHETGQLPSEVRLHFLDSGTVGRAVPDPDRLARARERMAAAAAGIRGGEFKAKPNPVACGYCPFRQICSSSAA
ncbi:MAG TPA: ATP-dependent DNA helicase [Candidatus Limnocylindrales bacterium]|nr:ATP-dependent DNA helicase [Candidatus Limnocylindrales bacterium]